MNWKDYLVSATFRGVPFHIETEAKSGGKRLISHEFPKNNLGYSEEMGRKLKSFSIDGYVIGDNFMLYRDLLVQALDSDGAGWLCLPTGYSGMVMCESFSVNEQRTSGGKADITMTFVESGQAPFAFGLIDTAINLTAMAGQTSASVSHLLNSVLTDY